MRLCASSGHITAARVLGLNYTDGGGTLMGEKRQPKTFQEAVDELREAVYQLIDEIVKALRLQQFLEWLSRGAVTARRFGKDRRKT